MTEEIKGVLIFEMLGRPAEHLKSTLNEFIDKLSKEAGVEILNKKFNEPKRVEQVEEELFTTFAETEINFKNFLSLLRIVFVYMPSHVEVISPSELGIKNFDFNTLMNELVRKLHQYDEIAKRLVIEISVLQRQLQEQGVKPSIPFLGQQTQANGQQAQAKETKTEEKEGKKRKNTKAKKKRKSIKRGKRRKEKEKLGSLQILV